ncbi:non-ribosomal peptide synthetase [Actinocrispum wychmicini]|uniref:Amino acid adenylation domain-containing protein n=1 Tax=Actinocrispum wychmicini TaxID=1213861 RepID=A0A4R2J8W6_9PSEU|nr:non-ribosomal peptide synthetase [Actinocrispum wychmicini]TCO55751.1 amino acid adenylation domain-containing protein [Actinocrispum wychmicini]
MTHRSAGGFDDDTTHAILLRLSDPSLVAVARAEAARRGFWVEDAGFRSGSEHAERLRWREARRPLNPDDPGPRVVLTRYTDGAADLVVSARRSALDHAGLRGLARALTTREDLLLEPPPVGGVRLTAALAPPWGLLDDEPVPPDDTSPKGDFAADVVLAATAVVLYRYQRDALVRVAAVTEAGVRVVELTAHEDQPVADLRASVRSAPGAPDGESPAVWVVLTGDADYIPLPTDGFPLVLSWHGDADVFAFAGLEHARSAVHAVVAHDFARATAYVAAQLADACPDAVVGDLELMDTAAAAAVVDLGRTSVPPAPTLTIHDAVAKFAATHPDSVAVSDDRSSLTYAELEARATAWARALVDRGAGPGRFVGVCLKRMTDLVVAMLAVLKTGAAYVPMDPQSPDERLRFIAEDAGLVAVVTSVSGFPTEGAVRPAELTASTSTTGLPRARPDAPAYVIYTSGTTGRPKGVVVPHRNVLALLAATVDDMSLSTEDVWSCFHSVAFDFSVWEIWGCLVTGGRLVLVPYLVTRSPEEFHALLGREGVTVLSQTPSAFAGLVEADARANAGAPRLIVFGGEAFDPRPAVGWLRRHPESRLVNMYGITETTVHVTAQEVRLRDLRTRRYCVGQAIPGWTVSIRDSRGRPQPPGAVGEIWVGGAGLATHYLNRPELTAERFVLDPYTGERQYRSGDLGRLRMDGSLDHAGRLDDQVKIRGFRIELGEIRAALLDAGAVDAAVVVAGQEAGPEYARLVAYVVVPSGGTAADVRRRAGMVLPDYMVPAELVELPALPLTLNGKLDRAALPAVTIPSTVDEPGPVDGMLSVWRSVIGPHVGPDDHFFDLGGNSLLAVRLLATLRRAGFGSIALRDLYRHPTPNGLAASLSNG